MEIFMKNLIKLSMQQIINDPSCAESVAKIVLSALETRDIKAKRTLNSLGMTIGLAVKNGYPTKSGERKIISALNNFDGNVDGRRSSQVGHMLRKLISLEVGYRLERAIEEFLGKYPELEQIPKRETFDGNKT